MICGPNTPILRGFGPRRADRPPRQGPSHCGQAGRSGIIASQPQHDFPGDAGGSRAGRGEGAAIHRKGSPGEPIRAQRAQDRMPSLAVDQAPPRQRRCRSPRRGLTAPRPRRRAPTARPSGLHRPTDAHELHPWGAGPFLDATGIEPAPQGHAVPSPATCSRRLVIRGPETQGGSDRNPDRLGV
jgi:hypothetical protein